MRRDRESSTISGWHVAGSCLMSILLVSLKFLMLSFAMPI